MDVVPSTSTTCEAPTEVLLVPSSSATVSLLPDWAAASKTILLIVCNKDLTNASLEVTEEKIDSNIALEITCLSCTSIFSSIFNRDFGFCLSLSPCIKIAIFIHGDNDKQNPKSLLKMLEKMLVHDKHVISKAMFESIFSSVTSNEAFVRSLLQTINKIVFEAAAQSGNKETVAELEGTRRTSVGASQVVEVEGTTSKFDVALLQPLLFRLSSLPRTFELFFSLQFF